MNKEQLTRLGLTKAESLIYQTLLGLGPSTVKQISKGCGFHRTNIYDVLEQLKEKGLVSFSKEGKSIIYSASNPSNLYDLLQEKKELLDKIFPGLEEMYNQKSEEIQVEVFKGEEGMKSTFRDFLKEKKPLYGFGIKGQLRDKLPLFAEQWLRDAKNQKLKYYGIYTQRQYNPSYYTEIRYVSEELSSPVATFICGDKININIWEPKLIAIVIKSKLVSGMYKKHFDLLWKIAKKE